MNIVTLEVLEKASITFLERIQIYNPIQASIYQNQIVTGARFNDVAKLANWSIVNDKTIKLQPQKKNDIRVFNIEELDVMLVDQLRSGYDMYRQTSYKNAVEVFNSMFPVRRMMVKNKSIKTHIFRHIKAKQLKRQELSDNDIRLYLGERSQRSANDYIYSTIYSNWEKL